MTSPKIEAVAWVEVGQFCLGRPQEWELLETPSEAEDQPLYSQQTVDALLAEVERYKVAWQEFNDRTEWVQQTAQPRELGKHRADVLRERIERAEAQAEANRRDAERYRFLAADHPLAWEEELDAAIGGREG